MSLGLRFVARAPKAAEQQSPEFADGSCATKAPEVLAAPFTSRRSLAKSPGPCLPVIVWGMEGVFLESCDTTFMEVGRAENQGDM